jgi:serine/threonine protein kinase
MTPSEVRIAELLEKALAGHRSGRTGAASALPASDPDLAADLLPLLQTMLDLDTAAGSWKLTPPAAEPDAPTADALRGSRPDQPAAEYRPAPETGRDESAQAPADTPPIRDPRLPGTIGRYRVLQRIGAGGMGTVYKAQDEQLQRVVALKVPRLDREDPSHALRVQRFLREARSAALIRHGRVCPIYDVGEHEGLPYVVMAYVEGQSLAERLSGKRRFEDLNEAVALARQVAEALEVVHAHGIVHRDLKPGNILLDRDGQVVLTDFGLARPENDPERLTVEGELVGTPAYMAPEQAAGQTERVGPRTDLYSLGVVLYQMATGRLPFEGPTLSVLYRIAHESPPPPSRARKELGPALEAIILKAMAPKPEGRYASAREFAVALEQWLQGMDRAGDHPSPAVGDTPATQIQSDLPDGSTVSVTVKHPAAGKVTVKVNDQQTGKQKRRRRLTVTITLAFTILVAVGTGIGLFQSHHRLTMEMPDDRAPVHGLSRDPTRQREQEVERRLFAMRAELEKAQQQLAALQKEYDALKPLVEKGVEIQSRLFDQRAALESAERKLAALKKMYDQDKPLAEKGLIRRSDLARTEEQLKGAARAVDFFKSKIDLLETNRAHLKPDLIKVRRVGAQLMDLRSHLVDGEQRLAALQKEYETLKPLAAKGLILQVELKKTTEALKDTRKQIDTYKDQIRMVEAVLK